MDILIAVRSEGKKMILNSEGKCITLDQLFQSVDGVMEYLENTGLADIFREKRIMQLFFDKDNMEIINFGGKIHEFAIKKCENIAKNRSLLILFYRKYLNLQTGLNKIT